LGKDLSLKNWTVEDAPIHSNIIWENFFAGGIAVSLKGFVINLLIFVLALTLAAPIFIIEGL
jgi:hypothetical protein